MPGVVAFMDDLLFLSRIREAARALAIDVTSVRRPADLIAACRQGAGVVFVDLDSPRLPVTEALAALRREAGLAETALVGFFSHVHPERARAAQALGVGRVLPRSQFVEELPALLRGAAEQ